MGQALQKFDVRTSLALQRGRSLRAQQVQRLRRVGVLVPAAADDPEARLPPVQEVASAETMKRALCDVSETALLSHFLTLPELP
jgi:hypothetical protein